LAQFTSDSFQDESEEWNTPPESESLLSPESTVMLRMAWVIVQPPVSTSNRRRKSLTGSPSARMRELDPRFRVGEASLIVASAAGANATFARGSVVVVVEPSSARASR
jgi:hypothetical protein